MKKILSCMSWFSRSSEYVQAFQLMNYQHHQLLSMVCRMLLDSYVLWFIYYEGWRRYWNNEWLHFVDKISKCLYLQFLFERYSQLSQILSHCTEGLVLFIVDNFPVKYKTEFIREIINHYVKNYLISSANSLVEVSLKLMIPWFPALRWRNIMGKIDNILIKIREWPISQFSFHFIQTVPVNSRTPWQEIQGLYQV